MDNVISFSNVTKTFTVSDKSSNSIMDRVFNILKSRNSRRIVAVENVNFDIKKGEIVGILGHNGSGKSTLLKLMNGAYPPDKKNSIFSCGKIIRLSLGVGFDHNLTARENIYLNGSILGLSFKRIGQKFNDIIDFSGLNEFVDTQIKYYSNGMVSRLAFAIALNAEADILLLDEFFGGVGDIEFRRKSEKAFYELLRNKTIVIVSHDLEQIRNHCDRLFVMQNGRMIYDGEVSSGIKLYEGLYEEN